MGSPAWSRVVLGISLCGAISCTSEETKETDSTRDVLPKEASAAGLFSDFTTEGPPTKLHIKYPLDGAMFPLEIAPAAVKWRDTSSGADEWLVRIGERGRAPLVEEFIDKQEWKPRPDVWKGILRGALKRPIAISIIGRQHGKPNRLLSGDEVQIRASQDPVGAPIFFREVPLPFDYANRFPEKIRYRLGHVSAEPKPRVLMENLPLCGNCHSSSKDGQTLGMDVDYANDKGSYVITQIEKTTDLTPSKIITWSDADKNDDALTFGLLSQVSPDGRSVVSTVKDRSIFVGVEDNLAYSQLFFPIKGILSTYDRESGAFTDLPGASDPDHVQSNPAWSPDGQTLLFARAPAYRSKKLEETTSTIVPKEAASEFLNGGRKFRYDIYKVPFSEGKGGEASPLRGASNNGKSNYFPKITPDGKWVVFVQADSFMLLQPDSKLYIVPIEGGTPRRMSCNTSAMNSWHSFSPNGRWMVFSSKEHGPYTKLWLTHLDEQGRDTPAVVLEHLSTPKRAANIPEFLNIEDDALHALVDQFSEGGNYHYRIAKNLLRYGDLKGALEALDRAAKKQPKDPEVFLERGALRFRLKKTDLALRDFERASTLAPSDFRGPYNLALALSALKKQAEADAALDRAAVLNPKSFDIWSKKAALRLDLGDAAGAAEALARAISLNPKNQELLSLREKLKGTDHGR